MKYRKPRLKRSGLWEKATAKEIEQVSDLSKRNRGLSNIAIDEDGNLYNVLSENNNDENDD